MPLYLLQNTTARYPSIRNLLQYFTSLIKPFSYSNELIKSNRIMLAGTSTWVLSYYVQIEIGNSLFNMVRNVIPEAIFDGNFYMVN